MVRPGRFTIFTVGITQRWGWWDLPLGTRHWLRRRSKGPAGLNAQIAQGIKEDGFWYEGSIGYHFYTIHSMEPLILAARAQQYPIADLKRFLRCIRRRWRWRLTTVSFRAITMAGAE